MTPICPTSEYFDEIASLVQQFLEDPNTLDEELHRLAVLLGEYDNAECPEGNPCTAQTCRYSYPYDWLEFHGFTNMHDFIDKIRKRKLPKSLEALNARWARRPGHYNG